MVELLIDDSQNIEIEKDLIFELEKVIESSLESEAIHNDCQVSLTFTDNAEIRLLNSKYRKIDKATDVLSFPLYTKNELENLKENGSSTQLILGDIVISVEKAQEQAVEYGHSFKRELSFLVCHSIFHLIGYDHMNEEEAKIMRQKERNVLEMLNIYR